MNRFLVLMLAFVFSCFLLSGCVPGASEEELLKRAETNLEQKDYVASIIDLKDLLSRNASSARARLLLGKAQYETAAYFDAEKELIRAMELGVAEEDYLPILARVYLHTNKHDEVNALNIAGLSDQAVGDILASKVLASMVLGELKSAHVYLVDAIARAPESSYVRLAQGRLLLTEGKYDEASKLVDTLLEQDPENASIYSLKGDIQKRLGNLDEARKAFFQATRYGTNNYTDWLNLSFVDIAQKQYAPALERLTTLKKIMPKSPAVNYALGTVHYYQNNYQEAIDTLATVPESMYPLTLFYQASSNLFLGNLVQAENLAGRLLNVVPDHPATLTVLASVRMRQQRYEEAEKLISSLVTSDTDDAKLLSFLAEALIQQGRAAEAIPYLKRVAELDSTSASAQAKLGYGLLAQGERQEGLRQLELAVDLDPAFAEGYAMLAVNHLQRGQFDQAIKVAMEYRDKNPGSAAPYNLLGRVYVAMNLKKEASEAFHEALKVSPGDPMASQYLIQFAMVDKDLKAARTLAESVLAVHKDHLPTTMQLVSIDLQEKKHKQMVERLTGAIAAHPDAVEPRIGLARYHLVNGEPEKVKVDLGGFFQQPEDNQVVLELITLSSLAQSDYLKAVDAAGRLAQVNPKLPQAHFMLARANAELNRIDEMEKALNKVIELNPRHFDAQLALARLFRERNEEQQFAGKLEILKTINPDYPDLLALEAQWENQQGNPEQAIKLYQRAYELNPSTGTMLALSRQKGLMQDKSGALALQTQWVGEHPEDIVARHALAGLHMTMGETGAANEQYRKILQVDGDNFSALNNLAWNLREADTRQALKYAERALKIAPEDSSVLDTYGMIMLEDGQLEKALRNIERALVKTPDNPVLLYHKALVLHSMGKLQQAEQLLGQALAVDSGFPERGQAEGLLNRIREGG